VLISVYRVKISLFLPQCICHVCLAMETNSQTQLSVLCKMESFFIFLYSVAGTRVVSVLDSGTEGPGFKSQSRRCRVTVLDKLFTPTVPLSPISETGSSPLKGCGGNCRPGGK